ncbi:hypothetical protein TRIUR3_12303 [Triticum urartu]|uniref:Uncharacterized protein n=1 Tax=Triticum urartu TaxID=4572 RepID=M7ZQJ3_TRIUA|nr:hypothetical protein TRIUR3_12303 [Triticum urartu]
MAPSTPTGYYKCGPTQSPTLSYAPATSALPPETDTQVRCDAGGLLGGIPMDRTPAGGCRLELVRYHHEYRDGWTGRKGGSQGDIGKKHGLQDLKN